MTASLQSSKTATKGGAAPAAAQGPSPSRRLSARALKLKDGRFPAAEAAEAAWGVWDYDDFLDPRHRDWYENWISFDCLLADDRRGVLWCGIATFTGDIFWAWDLKERRFRSLDYPKVGDRYDAKFHRALLYDRRGTIWAATALYHDLDRYHDAPGGAIVRFDPDAERLEVVARPIPHVYIQSILLDPKRDILYGQTYTPEHLFAYDLQSGKTTDLGLLGAGTSLAQVEQLAIDRNGTLWGTYAAGRAWSNAPGPVPYRLWRYHPDDGKRTYLKVGLPSLDGKGFVRQDGAHTGPDGAVYMGTLEGLLCRIDPDSGKLDVIGKPAPGRRLTGMVNGPDGNLYGSCGRDGMAHLFRLHPGSGNLDNLGPIFDPELGEGAWQVHDLAVMADGTFYAGENDVPHRSSYLWEITGVL